MLPSLLIILISSVRPNIIILMSVPPNMRSLLLLQRLHYNNCSHIMSAHIISSDESSIKIFSIRESLVEFQKAKKSAESDPRSQKICSA